MPQKNTSYRPTEPMSYKKRAGYLTEQVLHWIQSEDSKVSAAIIATEELGHFHSEDIHYSLRCLEEQLIRQDLIQWVHRLKLPEVPSSEEQETICCIHAGNLPLVGLQDLLAVLISGHRYVGKLSTKDPYLLESLLEFLSNGLFADQIQSWSRTTIQEVSEPYDRVLFSGSSDSLEHIQHAFYQSGQATPITQWLNRTASFSLYYCESMSEFNEQKEHLIDAIFRHQGRGCRSVAVIAAPFGLHQIADHFNQALSNFFEQHPGRAVALKQTPQENRLSPKYQQAYNIAVKRDSIQWGNWSIEEHTSTHAPTPYHSTQMYWLKVDPHALPDLIEGYGGKLQTVYTAEETHHTDPLSTAQCPALYWKADGIDTLEYLCSNTIRA